MKLGEEADFGQRHVLPDDAVQARMGARDPQQQSFLRALATYCDESAGPALPSQARPGPAGARGPAWQRRPDSGSYGRKAIGCIRART